jgi:hypothetical protein
MASSLSLKEMKQFVRDHFEEFVNKRNADVIRKNLTADSRQAGRWLRGSRQPAAQEHFQVDPRLRFIGSRRATPLETHGEAAIKQFKAAWERSASDEANLIEFLNAKRKRRWSCATFSYRQPRGLSFAAPNVAEVFFILCSREQIAFSLDASTVLRG